MAKVLDLDVLRPEKNTVKLGGKDIDVSFLPLGLTFDIDDIVSECAKLDQEKLSASDTAEVKKAFALSVKLCVVFCEHQHPDMDQSWFDKNTTAAQIKGLGDRIRDALTRAYEGIDPKN